MKKNLFILLLLCCVGGVFAQKQTADLNQTITLPDPQTNSQFSLEQVIANRRSVRSFTSDLLETTEIGQLCFAAQGITDKEKNLRSTPSAGGIYPMQLNVVLPDGVYLYEPATHSLLKKAARDVRPMLYVSSFKQSVVQKSPCIFVISGAARKVEVKYRGKGAKFTAMEAGHIAQNIHLQAVSLGLGSVPVGGFAPKSAARVCKLENGLEPLYLICVGNPAEKPALIPAVGSSSPVAVAEKKSDGLITKRVAIIVAKKYFDDSQYYGIEEALSIVGILPDIASSVVGEIKGIERNVISSNVLLDDLNADDYDALVFIGGPGAREHLENKRLIRLVQQADKSNKILAAIGVMPKLFANANIVKGRTVASFHSQRNSLNKAGADWKNTSVEIDGNMVTANGTDAARRFGVAILNLLRRQK